MATNSVESGITMAEVMKAYGHDDKFLSVVNGLSERNDMIADAPYTEASTITYNEISRVASLPAPTWIKVGEGWTATMGRLQNDQEGIATMKGRAQINQDVAKKQANPARYMQLQETLHLEGMSQEAANTFVYGSSGTSPEEFDGIDIRYASLSSATVWPSGGVFDNGEDTGSTCSSIWLIQWDEADCMLIYPRYDPNAGLSREEKSAQLLPTVTGSSPYENVAKAWFDITEFEWSLGFSLSDNRRIKRVCNINSSPDDAHTVDEKVLSHAIADFENAGPIMMYCNKQIQAQLQDRANEKGNVHFTPDSPFGKPMYYFLDVPIRRMEAITNAEDVLTT